eukprot:GFUD01006072.1.p1 GENE.GFUD01006072.1~~GFUD01006072.1.p1  ORF type:complete len:154 (-),score=73.35 GFUD01006072.1:65-526(-)
MERTISSWLVPLLLAVGCVALVGNIFHARKVNKSLMVDIEQAQADLQVASDNSQDCTKKMAANAADMTAKDQQVATLTANVATLTEEKTKIQEQVTQLTAQLEEATAANTALQAEITDSKAAKAAMEKPEEGKKEEAPKEEEKKPEAKPAEAA